MVVRRLPYPLSPHSDKTVVLSVQSGLASRLSDVSALHAGMRFKVSALYFLRRILESTYVFIYYLLHYGIYFKKLHKYQHYLGKLKILILI